jgi:D-alanyl-D-alanine carboxypeptidase/D-alanyl-D-alanine-endopeptidase (penicillin-binding protein 4)
MSHAGHVFACSRSSGRRRLLGAAAAWAFARTARAAAPPAVAASLPPAVLGSVRGTGLPLKSFGLFARPVEGAEGRPLAALNEEQPYVLASTAKVVTSLAALDLLGPHYRWRTYAFLDGPLVGGRLKGDLLIVGGGNARLTTADLRQWFAQMRAQGLKDIEGRIVLDRFAFRLHEEDHAHTPKPAPGRPHHAWPDALTLDEGVLQVEVAATRAGRASISLTPPLADVQVVNAVAMGGGCGASAVMNDKTSPPRLIVSGSWSAGCGVRRIGFVPLPHGEFTTHAVAGLWREAGGRLGGGVVDKARPDRQDLFPLDADGQPRLPWLVHLSDPLPQVIHDMNKTSNNVAARNLMLSLTRGFPMRAATLPEAQQRMQDWLHRQGLGAGDIEIETGSGLSRAERGKPRAMVQLLCNAWRARSAQAFVDSLPIAGVDGTLMHRLQHGQATGQAFLKTGTLLDTRALAGYVRARSGRTHAVAAFANHPEAARATPALDAFIEWIAKNG